MAEEPHHSIGEVLSLLKEEHADVTISKIRFLESQGLISPERTPSGYRKFYRDDIDRLRWILTQQRDSFLPLKVIKRRLAEEGFDPAAELDTDDAAGPLPEPSLFSNREDEPATATAEEAPKPAEEATPETAPEPDSTPTASSAAATVGSVSMTAGQLADATGSDLGFVTELDRMGLIEPVETDAGPVYDHEALLATRAAVRFRDAGMEVRHLRMHKVAADREAGLLQQLRAAALARGGEAAATARRELTDLIDQGEAIRRSILRRELGLDR